MKDVILRKSKIHGKGAFANRDFKKGELVIDYSKCSKKLSKEQVKQLPEYKKTCVSYINGKYILFKAPAKYINHSCDANTEAVNKGDVSIRDIRKGEEITADYSKENILFKFKCNCKSKNCKKLIGNENQNQGI